MGGGGRGEERGWEGRRGGEWSIEGGCEKRGRGMCVWWGEARNGGGGVRKRVGGRLGESWGRGGGNGGRRKNQRRGYAGSGRRGEGGSMRGVGGALWTMKEKGEGFERMGGDGATEVGY